MEPYTIVLNRILSEAGSRRASDIHLSVGHVPQLRIDGKLVALENESIVEEALVNAISQAIFSQPEIDRLQQERSVTAVKVFGGHFRFKVTAYYENNFLAFTFRAIPQTITPLEKLGLPKTAESFAQLTHGLVIVAGSFGSGKSATVNAFVQAIDRTRSARIVMIERPVEMIHTSRQGMIEQREVGRDLPDFAAGVAALQRDDVDVAVIGEVGAHAEKLAPAVLEAAASGRLVIWELQAPTAVRAIERMVAGFSAANITAGKNLLADVLRGIVVQMLVPKSGGGRVLAAEVLVNTPAVAAAVREGTLERLETVMQTSASEGMRTMTSALSQLVANGTVSRHDAMAAAPHPEDLHILTG